MRDAPERDRPERPPAAGPPRTDARPEPADPLVARVALRLAQPGLVMITGAPGAGRSSALRGIADSFRGPVFAGGGLAILRTVPGLALSRAVRARLPVEDQPLTAEAVRSRVRGGLLLLDDVQWADPLTLAVLPELAGHCRVVAALRTPHRLPEAAVRALRDAAADWLAVPALPADRATELARRTAPTLPPAALTEVVTRAGGVPLAVEALARHAAAHAGALPAAAPDSSNVAHAVAEALADLTRPARTAMAALGMLRRPAPRTLLGAGVDELTDAGLVTLDGAEVAPVSPYVAEVAAGLLGGDERAALHRRLAELVGDAEAARHLAAAGDGPAAYRRAVAAADGIRTAGERAELLLLACGQPGVTVEPAVRAGAAAAALAAGRPRAALRALAGAADPESVVLRGEALLQAGDAAGAVREVVAVPDAAGDDATASRDRVRLLGLLASDPPAAAELAEEITSRLGAEPGHAGLRAALAAARARRRAAGWERGLALAAAAAGGHGDALAARWSAWLLVETLAADGRLTEAAGAASQAAEVCAADVAYSWQTRFLAAELWCTALRGERLDEVARRAVGLVDRSLPAVAHGYALAAASLAEADSGLLASARARLTDTPPPTDEATGAIPIPDGGADAADAQQRRAATARSTRSARRMASVAALLDWVATEAAWLDGQPERVTPPTAAERDVPLLAGLHTITDRWASYDRSPPATLPGTLPDPATAPAPAGTEAGDAVDPPASPAGVVTGRAAVPGALAGPGGTPGQAAPARGEAAPASATTYGSPAPAGSGAAPEPVEVTLAAWRAVAGDPGRSEEFEAAAAAWHAVAVREEVRCLLAHGVYAGSAESAVPPLLRAERLAEQAGLVVLLGRARRALRRYSVRRDTRGPRAGADLTERERDVLKLVAQGEPTRRIAGLLGISRETVETHIRSGMRKLGARTRTEAAALALEVLS